jgi:dihydroxy-acid dehydratase
MLNGRLGSNDKIGSGTVLWKARDLHAAGEIDDETLMAMISAGYVVLVYSKK